MRIFTGALALFAVFAVLSNFWFDAAREAARRGGTPEVADILSAGPVATLRVPAAVNGAQDSVFYIRGAQGSATAFLIDAENLIFATNAHVPRKILESSGGAAGKLVLKQANNLKFQCMIDASGVREHPGHELLQTIVDRYGPVLMRPLAVQPLGVEKLKIKPSRFELLSAVLGFDGAILKARKEDCNFDAAKPPRALELAQRAELRSLTAGSMIARISFPGGSGNLNAGIQDQNTVPRVDIGYIRAIDGYLPQPNKPAGEAAVRHLIAHTLPSAGGGSGGPFLDAAGRVVAVNQGGLGISGNLPVVCIPVSEENVPAFLRNAAPCAPSGSGTGRLLSRLDANILTQAVARENFAHRADMIHDLIGGKSDAELTAQYTAEIGMSMTASMSMVDVLENLNLQQIESRTAAKSSEFDPSKVSTGKYTIAYDTEFAEENCGASENAAACAVRYKLRLKLEPQRNLVVQATDVAMGALCDMDMELVQVGTNVRAAATGQKPILMIEGPLPSADFDLILTRKAGCTPAAEYLERLTWNAHAVVSQFDVTPGTAISKRDDGLVAAIQAAGRIMRQTVDLVAAPTVDLKDARPDEENKR